MGTKRRRGQTTPRSGYDTALFLTLPRAVYSARKRTRSGQKYCAWASGKLLQR